MIYVLVELVGERLTPQSEDRILKMMAEYLSPDRITTNFGAFETVSFIDIPQMHSNMFFKNHIRRYFKAL